jgi:hypothetical protein
MAGKPRGGRKVALTKTERQQRWRESKRQQSHTFVPTSRSSFPARDEMAGNETAISALLKIMRNETTSPRDRLNAAVSASRVERLQMPGEAPPASVQYLRDIIDDDSAATNFRREAAAATAYFERRSRKAALSFAISDVDAKRETWRRLLNGALRHHFWRHGRWPQDKALLLGQADEIDIVGLPDPEIVTAALLVPAGNRHTRRRQRAIDEPVTTGVWSGTESERKEVLRPLARAVHARLAQFESVG